MSFDHGRNRISLYISHILRTDRTDSRMQTMVSAGCRGRLQSNGGRAMASRRIGIPSRKSKSPMAKAPKARVKSASSKFASFCINKNAPVKKRNARRITEKILRQRMRSHFAALSFFCCLTSVMTSLRSVLVSAEGRAIRSPRQSSSTDTDSAAARSSSRATSG